MEFLSEQSIALAIENCNNIDRYIVLIVTRTWKAADYWSRYITDEYGLVFQHICKNKFTCTNGSTIYLVSQSSNMHGRRADLILHDRYLNYETSRILEYIENRPTHFKLNHIMEEQTNDKV